MAARKTSTSPTRIWKFSARVAEPAAIRGILFAASRYYNALVAIERARHDRFRAIRRLYAPELASLDDEWERADDAITEVYRATKRERQAHWRETGGERRRMLSAETQAVVDALKAQQRRVSDEAKAHRTTFKALLEPARIAFKVRATERAAGGGPRIKGAANASVLAEMLAEDAWSPAWAQIARSDDSAHRQSLAARAVCGLATGTYLQVEEAFQRAKKDSAPRPPRFRAFDGSGRLCVQTRDVTFATLPVSAKVADMTKRGDHSRMVVAILDQSIPRGERRSIAISAKLHRRPPPDAVVKWSSLMVRRIGERTVYEWQLTMEHPSFADPKRPSGQREAEHVRIGWANVDGGVRVAHWPGGEVVVPDGILAQHDHASLITSSADVHFDRAKRRLRLWMRGGPHRLTAWHRMHSDRARHNLRRACIEYASSRLDVAAMWTSWKADRLPRGEDLYAPAPVLRRWLAARGITDQADRAAWWMYTWARKDAHLCQYAIESARRFGARRDALLRSEAIRIATEFAAVTVDNYKIAGLKELPSLTMPGDAPREQAQHNAHAAAPGRFREMLVEVMGARCTPRERSGDAQKTGTARKRKVATDPAVDPSERDAASAAAEE